jgi:hypothetical protein
LVIKRRFCLKTTLGIVIVDVAGENIIPWSLIALLAILVSLP